MLDRVQLFNGSKVFFLKRRMRSAAGYLMGHNFHCCVIDGRSDEAIATLERQFDREVWDY